MDQTVSEWFKDQEFTSLPAGQRAAIIGEYFDENYTDDEFRSLPGDRQANIRNGFIAEHESAVAPNDSIMGRVKDVGVDIAKGVVGLGQSAVGLMKMEPTGLARKAFDAIGYDAEATNKFLSDLYSDERKQEEAEYEGAKGFVETIKTLVKEPALLAGRALESAPGMLGIMGAAKMAMGRAAASAWEAGVAKGITDRAVLLGISKKAGEKAAILTASAAEGAQQTGQSFDDLIKKADNLGKAYVASIASGIGTAGIAIAGGTIGTKLGLGDVEAGIASTIKKGGVAGRMAGGAFQEGVLEESLQSAQEQFFQNYGMGRPLGEGVLKATGTGLSIGTVTGGLLSTANKPEGQEPPPPPKIDDIATTDILNHGQPQQPQPFAFPAQTPEEQAAMESEILRQRQPKPPLQVRNQAEINRIAAEEEAQAETRRVDLLQQQGLGRTGEVPGQAVDIGQQGKEIGVRMGLPQPPTTLALPPGQGFEIVGETPRGLSLVPSQSIPMGGPQQPSQPTGPVDQGPIIPQTGPQEAAPDIQQPLLPGKPGRKDRLKAIKGIVSEINGNKLIDGEIKYDGVQEGIDDIPSAYQFTFTKGVASGGSFNVADITPEAITAAAIKKVEEFRLKAATGEPMQAKPAPLAETKKERSLREYREYVAGLQEADRARVADLIEEAPESPGIQMRKIQKALAETAAPAEDANEIVGAVKAKEPYQMTKDEYKKANPIRSAAFKMKDGTVYEGVTHPQIAVDEVSKGNVKSHKDFYGDNAVAGFVTIDGEFVTRDQALKIVGKADAKDIGGPYGIAEVKHRVHIEKALKEGVTVSKEVLKDYPDLAKAEPKPTEALEGEAKPTKTDLSMEFEENEYKIGKVTNEFLKTNLDPSTDQRLDEGVGNYKNKVVFKLKDGGYYHFTDIEPARGGRVRQKIINIPKDLVEPLSEPPKYVKGASSMFSNRVEAKEKPPAPRYFEKTGKSVTIPINDIVPRETIKDIDKLKRGRGLMDDAVVGKGKKRKPISVFKRADGKTVVLDGNTTYHLLKERGEAEVEAEIKKSIKQQGVESIEDLLKQAKQSYPELEKITRDFARRHGATAHLRPGEPLKSRESIERKVVADYKGDYSKVKDAAATTISFKSKDDLYAALPVFDKEYPVIELKDRIEKLLPTGYRDILMSVKLSSGHIAEIQFTVDYMFEAKETNGHMLYELQREFYNEGDGDTGRKLELMSKNYYDRVYQSSSSHDMASSIALSSEIISDLRAISMARGFEEISTRLSPSSLKTLNRLLGSSTTTKGTPPFVSTKRSDITSPPLSESTITAQKGKVKGEITPVSTGQSQETSHKVKPSKPLPTGTPSFSKKLLDLSSLPDTVSVRVTRITDAGDTVQVSVPASEAYQEMKDAKTMAARLVDLIGCL